MSSRCATGPVLNFHAVQPHPGPLDTRPSARWRLYSFMAASRWLLAPSWGGPSSAWGRTGYQGSLLISAFDAKIWWNQDECNKAQRRVLLLRHTSAEVILNCMEGRAAALRVKKLNLANPPPWADPLEPTAQRRCAGPPHQEGLASFRARVGTQPVRLFWVSGLPPRGPTLVRGLLRRAGDVPLLTPLGDVNP